MIQRLSEKTTTGMNRRHRLVSGVVFLALAGWTLGCSSGGGGGVFVIAPVFTASGSPATPNLVRLRGGAVQGDIVTVEVTITGVTTSSDLYSFAFDLQLSDPTVAQFVANSEVLGSALTPVPPQGSLLEATQAGDRVIIGVSKSGGGLGNGVPASEEVILSLDFQVLKEGVTGLRIVGSPSNQPAALDSTGAVVGSVVFDVASSTISAD